jgi:hypothetical protein
LRGPPATVTVPAALVFGLEVKQQHDFQELPAGGRGGSDGMFDTASLIFLVACTIVGLGIPVALLEVYYFRIRKRRQQGR